MEIIKQSFAPSIMYHGKPSRVRNVKLLNDRVIKENADFGKIIHRRAESDGFVN